MFKNAFNGKKNTLPKEREIGKSRRGFIYYIGNKNDGTDLSLNFELRNDIDRDLKNFLILLKKAVKEVEEELENFESRKNKELENKKDE